MFRNDTVGRFILVQGLWNPTPKMHNVSRGLSDYYSYFNASTGLVCALLYV